MKRIAFAMLLAVATAASRAGNEKSWVDYVSVMVGTESTFELSTGNTYPAIAMPWGMNFWVPQTGKMGDGWQYMYGATKIRGLKQTHQPSPWINDYGQFSILPTVGKPVFDEEKRASWYSHKAETATPYYYSVYLADYDVTAEMAPTDRAVLMQFTFPESSQANVVVDAFDKGSHIDVDQANQRITGYSVRNSGGVPENFRNYFVITFDKPFEVTMTSEGLGAEYAEKGHAGAIVTFKTRRGEKVTARVASSFISLEQAERNLKELGNDNMEQVKQKGRQRWNDVLGRIEIDDDNIDHLRTFYSCLYRSVLFPRSFYEIDAEGQPIHYSPYNGEVMPGYLFTDSGFWDTFRCLFPLLNLVYPSMNAKMQEGLANTYLESGFLPEWASPGHRNCMVGNNSASIVADAYLKGILRGYENTSVSSDKANLAPSRPRTSAPSKSIRNLTDNNFDTYWATPDGVTTATLEVTFRGRQRINRLKLQEYIPLGQRVEQFAIDYLDGKNWVPLKVNEATTTIGYKRLLRFRTIETKKLRIRFEKARGALCINEMGAYYAPNALERYDDDGKMIAIGPDEAEGNAVESLPFTLTDKGTEGFLLDMGQTTFLHSLHYQPAQEGMISHYELWAGNNPDQLKKIAEGEFSNIRNNPVTQDVYFATTEARYLLLRPTQMVSEGEQPKYGLLMVR